MAAIMSAINAAKKVEIDPYYDLRVSHAFELASLRHDLYGVIATSFKFGYVQGAKAERAARKKNRRTNNERINNHK